MCRVIRMQERGYEVSKPGFPRESFDSTDCYFSVVLGEWFGFAAFAVGGCHCAEEVSWSGYLFERYRVQGESRSLSARTGLFVLNVLTFHKEDVGLWSHAVVFPISPLRSFTKFIFALVSPHHLPAFWQFYISHSLIKYDGRLNLRDGSDTLLNNWRMVHICQWFPTYVNACVVCEEHLK